MNVLKKYLGGNFSEEEFEIISEQLISAKLDRDRRREWEQELKDLYKVTPNTVKKQMLPKKRRWLLLSVAAAVLLLCALIFLLPTASGPQYLQAVNGHIETLSIMGDQTVLRKGVDDVDRIRMQATLTYAKKAYTASIPLWEQLIDKPYSTAWDYFYLGLCHLQKTPSDPNKALEFLLRSKAIDGGPYEELNWVLALTYLKTGAIETAKSELNSIVRLKDYQAVKAAELLQQIP